MQATVERLTRDTVRKLLLREDKLTFNKAINVCQINELSEQRIKELTDSSEKQEVYGLRRRAQPQKKNFKERKEAHAGDIFDNCGNKHAKQRESCPANGKQCRACGKMNHFRKVCRSSKGRKSIPKPHSAHRHPANLVER